MSGQQTPRAALLHVAQEDAGMRLDNYLLRHLKGVPRSHVYRIIRSGEVRVNKGRARANSRLQARDSVRIPPLRTTSPDVPSPPGEGLVRCLEQAVLWEDEGLLVIDKPAGLAVHGGSGLRLGVIEAMRQMRPDLRYLELVHRLDRSTSGCLMLAKKRSVLRTLHDLIRSGAMQKHYVALLAGRLPKPAMAVEVPLLKVAAPGGGHRVSVHSEGKPAKTGLRMVRQFGDDCCQVDIRLYTGRTHQIRVHTAHIGHAVLGDERYGDRQANRWARQLGFKRMALHASQLGFTWPDSGESISVTAPLPDDMERFLGALA